MDSKRRRLCRDFADNKKAENIVVLDLRKLFSVTDVFVIATGTNEPHLRAIKDEIMNQARTGHGVRLSRAVGSGQSGYAWLAPGTTST